MPQQTGGLRRVLNATRFSWAGLRYAWREESAFRQELVLALMLAPAALWLGQSAVERALMIGSLMLVLMAELLNSAIEAVVDRGGTGQDPLAGAAKDLGSATVFIGLWVVIITWALILWPQLRALWS